MITNTAQMLKLLKQTLVNQAHFAAMLQQMAPDLVEDAERYRLVHKFAETVMTDTAKIILPQEESPQEATPQKAVANNTPKGVYSSGNNGITKANMIQGENVIQFKNRFEKP